MSKKTSPKPKKGGYKQIHQEEFDRIKGMFALDMTPVQILQITKRSRTTLAWIKKAANFEEYQAFITEFQKKYPKKDPASPRKLPASLTNTYGGLYAMVEDIQKNVAWMVAQMQELRKVNPDA